MEKHIVTENRRNWKWCIKEHKLPIFETRGVNPQIVTKINENGFRVKGLLDELLRPVHRWQTPSACIF